MRYGIIGVKGGVCKKHYGLLYNGGNGIIKLNLINKYYANNIRKRNNKFFDELLILINKYYDLEDLNRRNKTGLCSKKYNRIKRGSMKNEIEEEFNLEEHQKFLKENRKEFYEGCKRLEDTHKKMQESLENMKKITKEGTDKLLRMIP